ncbi:hypothetical protein [Candidatus Thiosymbion oneisti]|uniref:hypothetical protein n=1 Tax=Candidatus Thiosymbion oneisti TaxID=589554 RepID=UPI00106144DF|nr:hypothetical protein [Candidatus Thiosymbion oneisti]
MSLITKAVCSCVFVAMSHMAFAQNSPYTDIPSSFDFPASQEMLNHFIKTRNVSELRRHAWYLWAGINQPTPEGEPIWETWYQPHEVFRAPGATPQGPRIRRFEAPRQHDVAHTGPVPHAPGASLFSFVMFNQAARDHIQQEQLYLSSKLDQINDEFDDQSWEERNIPDFPPDAVVLKVVWWPVQATGLTALPVWDNDPANRVSPTTPRPSNPRTEWKRVVAIDPSEELFLPGRTTESIKYEGKDFRDAKIVSLDDFYHVKLDDSMVEAARKVPGVGNVQVGDYLALIAMHVTTKEIPDWVWATYWWHDDPTMDVYAADRINEVTGVWRNYLMDASYDFDLPKEYDGAPNAVINPYLEARFANGISSNCMTCHGRAMWPLPAFLPITRGENDDFHNDQVEEFEDGQDPAYDGTRTRLDFLWSLGFRVQQSIQ